MKNNNQSDNRLPTDFIQCLINPDWKEIGLARVMVAKKIEKNKISVVVFLVDIFCLGVKNVMDEWNLRKTAFNAMFLPATYFDCVPREISLANAKDIVWGAITYAKSLGFEPHPDFENAKHFLGGENLQPGKIKFGGPSGKPLYVVGPYEDAAEIIRMLKNHVGEDGFEAVFPDGS